MDYPSLLAQVFAPMLGLPDMVRTTHTGEAHPSTPIINENVSAGAQDKFSGLGFETTLGPFLGGFR
jgi:hypothetical protein